MVHKIELVAENSLAARLRWRGTGIYGPARRIIGTALHRYGVLLGFVILWYSASVQGWVNPAVLPSPERVLGALYHSLTQGHFWADIGISLERAGGAFIASVIVAIPLGLMMGSFHRFEIAIDPLLQLFRQTSALALYPVFILLLGLGETSKVFLVFWGSVFPLLMNTITGVQQADRKLIEMARVFGASKLQIFRRVVLPGAIPSIFVGLRLSATTALLLLVAAEMIGANQGVGFRIINAQYNFQIPMMFAAIFVLASLGLVINYVLVSLERYLCAWRH